jgi:hypothetical protein
MVQRKPNSFWRRLRIGFRSLRITLWLLLLLLVCGIFYLNRVGLPDFVKRPVLEKLRAGGIDLRFTRMRWHWERGIVAENVAFGPTTDAAAPSLTLREVAVGINLSALLHRHLQVDSLWLRQGRFSWPLSTNLTPRELAFENIQAELHLLPHDVWQLQPFRASFAGADIQLDAVITNASSIRDWKSFQASPARPAGVIQERLTLLADTLAKIHYSTPPRLKLEVRGDARNLSGLIARLTLQAADAQTPWGQVHQGNLSMALVPAGSNGAVRLELHLNAARAQTPWAITTNLTLSINADAAASDSDTFPVRLHLIAATARTPWGSADGVELNAEWLQSLTNALPLNAHAGLHVAEGRSPWGSARDASLNLNFSPATPIFTMSGTTNGWPFWQTLTPFEVGFAARAREAQFSKLNADELSCSGRWLAPELQISNLTAKLCGGTLDMQAGLNTITRKLRFNGRSGFEPHGLSGMLTEKSRHWLEQFSWSSPPRLQAAGTLTLPAWTHAWPDWQNEVQPTVSLQGYVQMDHAAFRGVTTDTLAAHFSYSNRFWRVPDLLATRPEGTLNLSHQSDEVTHSYSFQIHSTLDPLLIRPLLNTNQQRRFKLAGFTQPPVIDAEIHGRWYDLQSIGVRGHILVTNCSFRGQPISRVETGLDYTNGYLRCLAPRAEVGAQSAMASSVGVDLIGQRVYLTNATGQVDADVVTRMIGPKTTLIMAPYRFLHPPRVHAEGIIPIRDERLADLHFDVDGDSFQWWRLAATHISGHVDWVGEHLDLKQIQAAFYDGTAAGQAQFEFPQESPGTKFQFTVAVTNADLRALISNLSTRPGQLEGRLTGTATLTNGDTSDLTSLRGGGQVSLREGLIWSIPVFGILSPVLEGISPGLGSSRAGEASATFSITNGTLRSDDLEIRAAAVRLQYRGTLGMDRSFNARVQAELLRSTWVFGPVLSTMLWPVTKLFEYKVTGTLDAPKTEPVFILPKLLLLPLHPLRTLKELAPDSPAPPATNPLPAAP